MAGYVNKETAPEVASKVLEILTIAKDTGVVKKGANEATKCIEKGNAMFVVIAGDVSPQEVVVHLPSLCEEKGVSYEFIGTKRELGGAIGISVGCTAVAIEKPGNASELLRDVLEGEKKKAVKKEEKAEKKTEKKESKAEKKEVKKEKKEEKPEKKEEKPEKKEETKA
ncbi:ribosomal L7Ae/L30e/S12e/Gadd45 family protein [Candidatus Micrarchaeota archaeon]|jgi:large subunit ribosomal protein L7Ae|nr:ribosomal L7Ae/L30e/S12e/Gadd45 family protein [Candidatus Micrarchaeota archaeon]